MMQAMSEYTKDTFKKLEALAKDELPSAEAIKNRLNDEAVMARYVVALDDLRADFTRQSVTDEVWDLLIDWGHTMLGKRDAMLDGGIVNLAKIDQRSTHGCVILKKILPKKMSRPCPPWQNASLPLVLKM